MVEARVSWAWKVRHAPLQPRAVLGLGPVARQLGYRVTQLDAAHREALEGLVSERLLVLLGPEALLPWTDGVVYLGVDSRAPNLYLPTQREPDVHPALVERALLGNFPEVVPPVALAPELPGLLPLGAARPVFLPRFLQWLEAVR